MLLQFRSHLKLPKGKNGSGDIFCNISEAISILRYILNCRIKPFLVPQLPQYFHITDLRKGRAAGQGLRQRTFRTSRGKLPDQRLKGLRR